MFSIAQKRHISDEIQKLLRSTNHPELPESEISFELHVLGKEAWSWAKIKNNGVILSANMNPWNEKQDPIGGINSDE